MLRPMATAGLIPPPEIVPAVEIATYRAVTIAKVVILELSPAVGFLDVTHRITQVNKNVPQISAKKD